MRLALGGGRRNRPREACDGDGLEAIERGRMGGCRNGGKVEKCDAGREGMRYGERHAVGAAVA